MTIQEARDWLNPATSADTYRRACVKKGEEQANKDYATACVIACQCMSKVIAWEDDGH